MKKRLFSLFLALVFSVGLISTPITLASPSEEVITEGSALKSWDLVNMGQFKHAVSGTNIYDVAYETGESDIVWRVVSVTGNRAKLVSEYVLDIRQMDIRKWYVTYYLAELLLKY